jgi:hypothetical protein
MSRQTAVPATLTIFGAAPTRATLTIIPLGLGWRLARALGVLVACWGAAAVSVLIPVAHFLLVPALTIAGPLWAVLRFRQHQRVVRVRGVCPRCQRVQDFTLGSTLGRHPAVHCPACFNRLMVTIEDTGSAA